MYKFRQIRQIMKNLSFIYGKQYNFAKTKTDKKIEEINH